MAAKKRQAVNLRNQPMRFDRIRFFNGSGGPAPDFRFTPTKTTNGLVEVGDTQGAQSPVLPGAEVRIAPMDGSLANEQPDNVTIEFTADQLRTFNIPPPPGPLVLNVIRRINIHLHGNFLSDVEVISFDVNGNFIVNYYENLG